MTRDTMDKLARQIGREGVYGLIGKACARLDKQVFLRYCVEAFGSTELEGMAQRMMIDALAELNVLSELLAETCMTMSERYELNCAEEFAGNRLTEDILKEEA